jgi:hypothetical protein
MSMARNLTAVEITETSELLRIAEEVRATGQPRVIRRDGEEIAVLMPIGPRRGGAETSTPTTDQRRQSRQSIVERTAGALKHYAKRPPATIAEEKEAFVQGVAEEVAEHRRDEDGTPPTT